MKNTIINCSIFFIFLFQLNINVGDWTINITYKAPSNNPEKIKSLLIYSMTFPYTELDEFKEYLFEE